MTLTLGNVDIEQRIFVGGEKKNLVGEDFYVKYYGISWLVKDMQIYPRTYK